MSRPPYPHAENSTGREQSGDLARLDYLPLEYADLLALEEDLAATTLARPRAASGAVEEADVTSTFMELSALVGHVLAVYQRQRAGEAFISTAQAPSSLVRHAHRLAYDPDPGLAAGGHVVVIAKDGVTGTIEAALALASAPLGEIKAQDYESDADLPVDAALNVLLPANATRIVKLPAAAKAFVLRGVGHGLQAGDRVALVGAQWSGFVITGVVEDAARDVTVVTVDRPLGTPLDFATTTPPTLLGRPALVLRAFGTAADPAQFPPSALKTASTTEPDTTVALGWWYSSAAAADVFLDRLVERSLTGELVLRASGGDLAVLKVANEAPAAVTLNRREKLTFARSKVTITPVAGGGFTTTLSADTPLTQDAYTHISGTVTAIRVKATEAGGTLKRADMPVPADWLADWGVAAPLATIEPNDAKVETSLVLPGVLTGLTPGRPLVFSTLDGSVAQVVAIQTVTPATTTTTITWDDLTTLPAGFAWHLHNLKVYGNVARVSHGRTVHETLGGSDGVTPFQRFALRESPVTVLPGVAGGEPELEVRVDDVLWTRVQDFAPSAPDDRHYRAITDAERVTAVVFGDGRNGAVPPSGRKNVTAVYRVGLGLAGNVEPGRLSRLKRAHPLVDRVVNPTLVAGGSEPAGPEGIRAQATRWIRTFDRAVSVADHADLALTMPGIARAAARADQKGGVILVVADSTGGDPALTAVRAFLDARRDVSVPLTLTGPHARDIKLGVDLEPDPAFRLETVKDSVRAALGGDGGQFTFAASGLGQPAYLSDVYARLEVVPGVAGVRVHTFCVEQHDTLADVIAAGVDEWLRLQRENLTLGIVA